MLPADLVQAHRSYLRTRMFDSLDGLRGLCIRLWQIQGLAPPRHLALHRRSRLVEGEASIREEADPERLGFAVEMAQPGLAGAAAVDMFFVRRGFLIATNPVAASSGMCSATSKLKTRSAIQGNSCPFDRSIRATS